MESNGGIQRTLEKILDALGDQSLAAAILVLTSTYKRGRRQFHFPTRLERTYPSVHNVKEIESERLTFSQRAVGRIAAELR